MREAKLGDNGGPPLADEDPGDASWKGWIWRKKSRAVWKTPGREIALRRLERAEALQHFVGIAVGERWTQERTGRVGDPQHEALGVELIDQRFTTA